MDNCSGVDAGAGAGISLERSCDKRRILGRVMDGWSVWGRGQYGHEVYLLLLGKGGKDEGREDGYREGVRKEGKRKDGRKGNRCKGGKAGKEERLRWE